MDKDILVPCITVVLITLILVLGIAIPYSISEKRNIEKELKLKEKEYEAEIQLKEINFEQALKVREIELYGEVKDE